ncbi:MAG TPA: hypothetical protein VGI55_07420 [Solirubrobacteraceae bacterium]
MRISRLAELSSFITADGSRIREIVGPSWTAARNQSLAEATVNPGEETLEHYHPKLWNTRERAAGAAVLLRPGVFARRHRDDGRLVS